MKLIVSLLTSAVVCRTYRYKDAKLGILRAEYTKVYSLMTKALHKCVLGFASELLGRSSLGCVRPVLFLSVGSVALRLQGLP